MTTPPNIPLAWPDIGPSEEAEVVEVLRSGRLALGPKTIEFERLVAEFAGVRWGAAVSSGTAGLHLAVRALEIGPEDCVVTTSFSFVASANCIRYEGGEPVFVDVDDATLCIDPDAVVDYLASCSEVGGPLHDPASGKRVAAILSVDVFGHPADLRRLRAVAEPFGLPILSDSCESLGSWIRSAEGARVHAGAEADVAVFAFYPNKQITTGEGGMVVGSDPEVEERVRGPRNQGRRANDPWLRHSRVGFNYRIDEMSAALGVAQMHRVEELLGRRAEVARWYREELAGVEELRLPETAPWAEPAWFVMPLRVERPAARDALIEHLAEDGIEAKAYFDPPIHLQPAYADREESRPLPVTEEAARTTLVVPFFSTMSREQVRRVKDSLTRGLAREKRSA
ncbi:MAG: DegT/DnrJ/EryC1/StrS family aminotransferase [Actinomycetota bacterium]